MSWEVPSFGLHRGKLCLKVWHIRVEQNSHIFTLYNAELRLNCSSKPRKQQRSPSVSRWGTCICNGRALQSLGEEDVKRSDCNKRGVGNWEATGRKEPRGYWSNISTCWPLLAKPEQRLWILLQGDLPQMETFGQFNKSIQAILIKLRGKFKGEIWKLVKYLILYEPQQKFQMQEFPVSWSEVHSHPWSGTTTTTNTEGVQLRGHSQ